GHTGPLRKANRPSGGLFRKTEIRKQKSEAGRRKSEVGDGCAQRECPSDFRFPSSDFRLHSSRNATCTPLRTRRARSSASQLVRRTQPCDSVLPILVGSGVPWMP